MFEKTMAVVGVFDKVYCNYDYILEFQLISLNVYGVLTDMI